MRKLVFLIFVSISYLLFRPIIANVWYPMHDTTSVARTYLLEKTISLGQVPAIWAAELDGGRGYPLFHFYAPAMTYLSLLGKTISGSYFVGIKAVLILASMTGMIGMYFLMRRYGRHAGMLSAISYGLLPYAAVNLYVRGAYAEYLSMSLLPWLFYVWRDYQPKTKTILTTTVTTLFILSHNLIPVITLPFLAVWVYLHHRHHLRVIIFPAILTILLSSFYLAPLMFERGFVEADQVATTTKYSDHFLAPWQIWNSTWGFGGSGLGVEDGMSFKVGKIQVVLALIGVASMLIKRDQKVWFFLISAIIAAFMTTASSNFIWQRLNYLQIVQFPWRFLSLLGFFVSILAGFSLTLVHHKFIKSIFFIPIVIAVILYNLKLFNPQSTYPADLTRFTSIDYLSTIPSIIPEYRPKWLDLNNPSVSDSYVLPYNYYPTWHVLVDGKQVPTYPSVDGNLAFSNPSQSLNITAIQAHTSLELISTLISLTTLVYLGYLYGKD